MKFEFLDKKFRPRYDFNLLYIPSSFCSLKCEYCPFYSNKKLDKQKYKIQKDFIHFLEKYKTSSNKNISLYGGEPFDNIDVYDFINEFITKWKFTILTNLSVEQDILKKILYHFPNNKINFIVSIHFHRIKNFDNFLEKLNLIINNGNIITIRAMIEKNQKEKIQKIFDLYYEKYENVKVINRLIYPIDKLTDISLYNENKIKYPESNFKVLYNNKIYNLRDFIDSPYNNFKNKLCEAGFKRLILNEDGNVFFCETAFLRNKFILGNIYNEKNWKKFIISNPIICPCETCRCELYLKKW